MLTIEQSHELYRRHAPAALRRAQRILGNVADAHDLVHDVFVVLLERCQQYRGASSLSTYLYVAVTHACLNRLRNARRQEELLAAEASGRRCELSVESTVIARELLERLPTPLADLAVYYHLEGLSQREIASELGCSHTHVAQLLDRLARWIKKHEVAACSPPECNARSATN